MTLNENTVIFELCYKIVGSSGQTACIDVRGNPDFPEWTNDKGEKVPLCYTFGKVNITSVPPAGATVFRVGTINGQANETVCVDVAVEKFTKVTGATVKFGWNADQLEFVRTDNYDLEILIIHFFYVLFVVGSLPLIWFGAWFKWVFVRSVWFRYLHLAAIVLVVIESLLGVVCPLTSSQLSQQTQHR